MKTGQILPQDILIQLEDDPNLQYLLDSGYKIIDKSVISKKRGNISLECELGWKKSEKFYDPPEGNKCVRVMDLGGLTGKVTTFTTYNEFSNRGVPSTLAALSSPMKLVDYEKGLEILANYARKNDSKFTKKPKVLSKEGKVGLGYRLGLFWVDVNEALGKTRDVDYASVSYVRDPVLGDFAWESHPGYRYQPLKAWQDAYNNQ